MKNSHYDRMVNVAVSYEQVTPFYKKWFNIKMASISSVSMATAMAIFILVVNVDTTEQFDSEFENFYIADNYLTLEDF